MPARDVIFGVGVFVLALDGLLTATASADELLYVYECDALPPEADEAWIVADPCDYPCTQSAENGHLGFFWPVAGNKVTYAYRIAVPGQSAPDTLWVEWRFRSNHPIGPIFWTCDGAFLVHHGAIVDVVWMYGDEAVSDEGGDSIGGLELNEFHTYRFESLDAVHYRMSANGQVFIEGIGTSPPNGYHTIQILGIGGCTSDQMPNKENAWDFVRFGTIGYGEQIVDCDPPDGFLDARRYTGVDRITITYDSPNYVYVDEISVQSTADPRAIGAGDPPSPAVLATRRLDNGPPDVVEVVLDRPIPFNATTRFLFDDGVAVNIIDYTFAPADADGDGLFRLSDFAYFQTCFGQTPLDGQSPLEGLCGVFDVDADSDVDLDDFATALLSGP